MIGSLEKAIIVPDTWTFDKSSSIGDPIDIIERLK
ncbi:MAG: hypothetical protein ACD_12C00343G0003 [uncultured bacterium]|nr:MAG: hypothetical protein ACD_12C00343G0003 [uncultured bacterium]